MAAITQDPTPGFWVNNLDPFIFRFPESFPLEGIRWYGTAYIAGFIFAAILLHFYYKKNRSPLNSDAQSTFLVSLVIGVLLGARLGYMLFYAWSSFISDPISLFKVWEGGMSAHGGIIGATLATWWMAAKNKYNFLQLGDIIASLAPAGIFFGRIANFINGELWGRETNVPWAVVFKIKQLDIHTQTERVLYLLPRHPSQLYEAATEGLLILVWTQWRFWKKTPLPHGQILGEACILYSIIRIANEFFREPDASLILSMTRGQFYSIILFCAGILIIYFSQYFSKKQKEKEIKE